jgi:hypothetical protein
MPWEQWQPDTLLVRVVRQPEAGSDDDALPDHSAVDHVRHPFAFEWAPDDLSLLRSRVLTYLDRVKRLLGLRDELLQALQERGNGLGFRWLGLPLAAMDKPALIDPAQSFRVARADDGASTLVLLAGNGLDRGEPVHLGAHVGLAVRVLLRPQGSGKVLARIVGAGASQLAHALLPDPARVLRIEPRAAVEALRDQGSEVFGLDPKKNTRIDGLGYAIDGGEFDVDFVTGSGQRDGRSFTWSARVVRVDGKALRLLPLTRLEQVSHAAHAVFQQDPVSQGSAASASARRPVRNDELLDDLRMPTQRLPAAVGDPLRTGEFVVSRSAVPDRAAMGNDWVLGDLKALRNDDLAAAQVYLRLRDFFDRLHDYGFKLPEVFRKAEGLLVGVPRAALPRAPDGRTVNAAVRADASFDPPRLQVGFGASQLSRRTEHRRGAHLRAEPLGLAADERWAWHEFGHVLAHGATGQLEFRFSHGVGDALAAVIADPDSQLHDDPEMCARTFPFAALGRRHNRPAERGWCFCGQRSTLRLAGSTRQMRTYAGYFEEQLFSTSIHRLYLSLGGATRGGPPAGDRAMRYSASDYVVHLLMHAIALMPSDGVKPTYTADEFAALLGAADAATHDFHIHPRWPERAVPRHVRRRGGRVGKVIDWAFEQQGLDARVAAGKVREGAAPPPEVDVYLRTVARADGGYQAVPLRWRVGHELWHSGAIAKQGSDLSVQVRNRGLQTANGVWAQAWWCRADAPGSLQWQALGATSPQNLPVDGRSSTSVDFRFALPATSGHYWVFAAAGCAADRSNIDPATALPFADGQPPRRPRELIELVANDNNCGLALLG